MKLFKAKGISALVIVFFTMSSFAYEPGWEPRDLSTSDVTKVLMLGTGNPLP